MAGTLGAILGKIIANSGATVAALIQGQAGTAITQASLSAITYYVYRRDNAGADTLTGSGALTVSAVVFDTAQVGDPRYTLSGGFNFLAVIPASCFTVLNRQHTIRVRFIPVSGEQFEQAWRGTTE